MWGNWKRTKLLVCLFTIASIVATQNVLCMEDEISPKYEIQDHILVIYETDLTGELFRNYVEDILLTIIGDHQHKNVHILFLSNYRLEKLPPSINRFKKLQILSLRNNELQDEAIKVLGELTELKILDLRSNQLTELPSVLGNLKQLESLFLGGNSITEIPREILRISGLEISPQSLVPKRLRDHISRTGIVLVINAGAGFAIGLVLEFVIYRALTTNRDYWCGPYYTG